MRDRVGATSVKPVSERGMVVEWREVIGGQRHFFFAAMMLSLRRSQKHRNHGTEDSRAKLVKLYGACGVLHRHLQAQIRSRRGPRQIGDFNFTSPICQCWLVRAYATARSGNGRMVGMVKVKHEVIQCMD